MAKKKVEKYKNSVNDTNDNSGGSGFIIGFLVGIIIMLLAIIALFAANVISFDNNKEEDKTGEVVDKKDDEEEEEKEKYVVTFKDEVKEFKNSKGEVVITNKRNKPVIVNSSNQVAADNMVDYLTDISNKQWDELNMNNYTKDDMLENLPLGIGIKYEFSLLINNDKYLTFEEVMSGSMGGVSWPGVWGYTFNTSNGELVSYRDMVKDTSADDFLYNYVISEIGENSHNDGDLYEGNTYGEKNWKEVVKEMMFKEGHYYLTSKGLKFTFDKYSLGVGALGVQEVVVPIDKVNTYLEDGFKY